MVRSSILFQEFIVLDLQFVASLSSQTPRTKLTSLTGVASHEGRVLVMTTNHPEQLDDALIRPGRVDHQVAFTHATQTQIKELFERMYTNDLPKPLPRPALSSAVQNGISIAEKEKILTPPLTPVALTDDAPKDAKTKVQQLSESERSDIAKAFADMIPDDLFSPAEIQGFLLKRKTDPRKALQEVGVWVDGMVEQKKMGRKLAVAQ
jgi:chaperone BCS1